MSKYKLPLKPCPKCKSTRIRIEYPTYEKVISNDRMDVICADCGEFLFRVDKTMKVEC